MKRLKRGETESSHKRSGFLSFIELGFFVCVIGFTIAVLAAKYQNTQRIASLREMNTNLEKLLEPVDFSELASIKYKEEAVLQQDFLHALLNNTTLSPDEELELATRIATTIQDYP